MKNSIARMRPELVLEWSPQNAPVTPEQVPFGSNKLYWWKGACGHEWQTSAKARSHGEKCPICANARIVAGVNDLRSQYPDLAAEWSNRNLIPASKVTPGSHKKAIWNGKCGHEWSASIRSRVGGAGCPYCSHNIVLPGFNDLEYLLPEIAKEWSPRNLPLKPSQVTAYSNRKVWWRCEKGHEWNTLISTRSYGSQCPYCSGIQLLKGFNDLATLHPHLAEEWSDRNGELTPDVVNDKSTKNVWWSCGVCGNEYKAVIKSRVHGLKCPVCAERAVLLGYNDLATTDPELAADWNSKKNSVQPTEISRHSMRPVWWKGACGHEWKDKVANRAIDKAGCIYCESDFRAVLPQLLVMLYAGQKGFKVLLQEDKTIGVPLDVYIPELRLTFLFPHKNTQREKDTLMVVKHLCEKRNIVCEIILQKNHMDLCAAIKRGFSKVHVFINSDSVNDMSIVKRKYRKIRENHMT